MSPIRKGDGTILNANGFSEVRKGDGTVLWSAGQIIDDFEDGDLSEYSGTGYCSIESTTVHEGTYSLHAAIDGSSNRMYSTSGLYAYPSRGDTIVYWLQFNHSATVSGLYICDNPLVYVGYDNSRFELQYNDGSVSVPAYDSNWDNTQYQGDWLKVTIVWNNGGGSDTFDAKLEEADSTEITSISGTIDTSGYTQYIGFETNNRDGQPTDSYFDFIVIQ